MIKREPKMKSMFLLTFAFFLFLFTGMGFPGQPNLVVSVDPVDQSTPITPSQFYQNRVIVFRAVVRNRGDAPAPASKIRFRIVFRRNTTPWNMSTPGVNKDYPVPALHPNTMAEIKMTHTIKKADYYRIHAYVDFDRKVRESEEEDNDSERDFQVVEKIEDISPYKIETYWIGPGNSKRKPCVGHKTQIVITIKNTGNTYLPTSQLRVDLIKSGRGAKYYKVPNLREGKTFSVTLVHRYHTRGNKKVRVFVDWGNKIVEKNERDSRYDHTFKVHLRPQ